MTSQRTLIFMIKKDLRCPENKDTDLHEFFGFTRI